MPSGPNEGNTHSGHREPSPHPSPLAPWTTPNYPMMSSGPPGNLLSTFPAGSTEGPRTAHGPFGRDPTRWHRWYLGGAAHTHRDRLESACGAGHLHPLNARHLCGAPPPLAKQGRWHSTRGNRGDGRNASGAGRPSSGVGLERMMRKFAGEEILKKKSNHQTRFANGSQKMKCNPCAGNATT